MSLRKVFSFGSILLILLCGLYSCKKGKNQTIPYVPVNIYINPSDPLYIKLAVPGGWLYLNGGSRGIIVYRRTVEEFVAYDRHCTYNVDDQCGKVSVNSTQIMAVDSCCLSEFVLTDGSVSKGPANQPLHQYQTSWDGNTLRIFN